MVRGRPRGTGLAEILIASSLMLLVTGVAYASLLLVNRSSMASSARTAAMINAEVALERLRRELQETSASSVTVLDAPPALSFLSARDASGEFRTTALGTPEWQGFRVYYLVGADGSLRRRSVSTGGRQALSRADLAAACHDGRSVVFGMEELWLRREGRRLTIGVTCASEFQGLQQRLPLTCMVEARN